jgi:hypothetical protein
MQGLSFSHKLLHPMRTHRQNQSLLMNNVLSAFSLLACLAFASCNTASMQTLKADESPAGVALPKAPLEGNTVPYVVAKNYFVKNTYQPGQLVNPKITSEEEFSRFFGLATTMGENGRPTPIDFTKQYAIAVIGAQTDKSTTLTVSSLQKVGAQVVLRYEEQVGASQSYTTQPFLLLIVSNEFAGEVTVEKK